MEQDGYCKERSKNARTEQLVLKLSTACWRRLLLAVQRSSLNEGGEPRNNHRYAIVRCTRIRHSVDSRLLMENKNFTRNDEEFTEVSRSEIQSKGNMFGIISGVWKSLRRSPMESLYVHISPIRDQRYCRKGSAWSQRSDTSYPLVVRTR